MKGVITFIVWLILGWIWGFLAGYYTMLNISLSSFVDNLPTLIENVKFDNQFSDKYKSVIEQEKQKLIERFKKEKENLKEQIKKQINDYISQKIDKIFNF